VPARGPDPLPWQPGDQQPHSACGPAWLPYRLPGVMLAAAPDVAWQGSVRAWQPTRLAAEGPGPTPGPWCFREPVAQKPHRPLDPCDGSPSASRGSAWGPRSGRRLWYRSVVYAGGITEPSSSAEVRREWSWAASSWPTGPPSPGSCGQVSPRAATLRGAVTAGRGGGGVADIDLAGWYGRLMAVNAEAFAAGHWEAAYHALTGALHCAVDLRDAEQLWEVSDWARQQQAAIVAQAPRHRLSTQRAGARGHKGLFETTAFMADIRIGMLRQVGAAGRGPTSPRPSGWRATTRSPCWSACRVRPASGSCGCSRPPAAGDSGACSQTTGARSLSRCSCRPCPARLLLRE
jgi:hypothetical protein